MPPIIPRKDYRKAAAAAHKKSVKFAMAVSKICRLKDAEDYTTKSKTVIKTGKPKKEKIEGAYRA